MTEWQRDGLRSLLEFQKNLFQGIPTSALTDAVFSHALANLGAGEVRERDLGAAVATAAGQPVTSRVVRTSPFCTASAFQLQGPTTGAPALIVAPYSGYAATVLRTLIAGLLPGREVVVTAWEDARSIPREAGGFDLDHQCQFVVDLMDELGPDLHVVGISQGTVPALAASAAVAAAADQGGPLSLSLLGGPIDPGVNMPPSQIGLVKLPLPVIEAIAFTRVGGRHPGAGRLVYPSMSQLALIAGGDIGTYAQTQIGAFTERLNGRADGYVEGLEDFHAVVDTPAELVMAMIRDIFRGRVLSEGRLTLRGEPVLTSALRRTALLTIEAQDDQLVGASQTHAAQGLCSNVDDRARSAYSVGGAAHPDLFLGPAAKAKVIPLIVETFNRFDPRTA